ncbi:hypothetical protein ABZ897_61775 [Nonomuraea sp. NPDC046802]|uniref:hypothetical protein n=1 Tax=Nonomuraea sp. NPDC046802 TaxID=3154919 RepID=UPI0033F63AA0
MKRKHAHARIYGAATALAILLDDEQTWDRHVIGKANEIADKMRGWLEDIVTLKPHTNYWDPVVVECRKIREEIDTIYNASLAIEVDDYAYSPEEGMRILKAARKLRRLTKR